MEGDPGYEPVVDPPDTFFHVVAVPPGTDEGMALVIHMAYEQGRPLEMVAGRRYLVNAVDEAAAAAQVTRIEQQIAEFDPEHLARHGGVPWEVRLTVVADPFVHARRDPEPAEYAEAWVLNGEAQHRRRSRSIEAGLG